MPPKPNHDRAYIIQRLPLAEDGFKATLKKYEARHKLTILAYDRINVLLDCLLPSDEEYQRYGHA